MCTHAVQSQHLTVDKMPCLRRLDSAMLPVSRQYHASGVKTGPCLRRRLRMCHASGVEREPCLHRRDSPMPPPSRHIPCLRRLA
ncbi:hypothetical protein L211DRAFT_462067 [Terfezia boudieri ATCC MYA-4762]|uniref:Uncharacterized protein n=1 Tax=Terfezia boudieri ATCC MYA-4762 TaxID=1051890 RepID=A0A3N4LDJ5_9PEZI|nr:hypothetical protein L211DRAFT_462067 [Terfezia boudieri ATCC MYA-4762]